MLCGLTALRICDELVHQVRVDVQAAGGVDDQDVLALHLGPVERPPGDLDRVDVSVPCS